MEEQKKRKPRRRKRNRKHVRATYTIQSLLSADVLTKLQKIKG
ncbi:hypothetical protein GCM10008934_16360 [Virgibacillus salarius]